MQPVVCKASVYSTTFSNIHVCLCTDTMPLILTRLLQIATATSSTCSAYVSMSSCITSVRSSFSVSLITTSSSSRGRKGGGEGGREGGREGEREREREREGERGGDGGRGGG